MVKILLGLLGLCIVVVIHELGHFIAARICGVTVESFSIGWGPVLFRKKKGNTEYRLSAIPLGGYCGMKGSSDIQLSLDARKKTIDAEPDSFYGVSPLARIFIAFLGPFFNVVFALLAIICIQGIGYTKESYGNQIVLASDFGLTADSPADNAQLKTGDTIVNADGTIITSFSDIQEYIGTRPGEEVALIIQRDGSEFSTTITPRLDPDTGIGKIGIYPLIPLEVMDIKPNSAASLAGLQKGDIVTAVAGQSLHHVIEFQTVVDQHRKDESIALNVSRNGDNIELQYIPQFTETNDIVFGIVWKYQSYEVKSNSVISAIVDGFCETVEMMRTTVKGITLLFRGVNIKNAVSGPVRITYMLGDIAESSFTAGIRQGIVAVLNFLSLISVSLFLMNLLPIPVLDGGTIFLSICQMIFMRKGLHPKLLYYFQLAGAAVILLLFVFAFFNDISFFVRN